MTLSVAYSITSERRIILGSEIWVIHGNTLAPYFRRNCSQLTSVLEEMQATSPATIRSPPQLQSFPKSHPFRPFLLSVAMAAMTTAFVPASTLRVAPAARNHVEVQGSVEKLDLDCQWWHWFSNKTMSDMSDMCFLLFVHVHFAFSEVFLEWFAISPMDRASIFISSGWVEHWMPCQAPNNGATGDHEFRSMTAAPMLLAAFGAARRIRPYPTSDWSTAGNDFEGKNLRMITVFIYIYIN